MFENKDYILNVIREGSISAAAKRMYISQPSLSASIKRIEEKISVPLLDRSTTPVSLTEAGREYVKYALQIEETERAFSQYISDHYHILTGTVRVGGSSFFASFILPKIIADFHSKYPHIEVEIFENNTEVLLEKLHTGELDIVIDNAIIKDDGIKETLFSPERLLLAVPASLRINEKLKDFRLTANDVAKGKHNKERYQLPLTTFADEPFILMNTGNDTGKRAAALFKKHKINPEVKFRLDQQLTSFNVSALGMGISFVSDTLIRQMEKIESLYYYAIPDEETKRNIFFYVKKNHYLSQVCQKFIEISK